MSAYYGAYSGEPYSVQHKTHSMIDRVIRRQGSVAGFVTQAPESRKDDTLSMKIKCPSGPFGEADSGGMKPVVDGRFSGRIDKCPELVYRNCTDYIASEVEQPFSC